MTGLTLPALALVYLPLLVQEQQALWPDMPAPPALAAQIEQETCPSLTHRKCWNPRTELKTSREYGFGLGQLTITPKFNNFEESKKWDKALAGWSWDDRYNPAMQIRALVAYDRNLFRRIRFGDSGQERLAFAMSAYNGGLGDVIKDRRLCASTTGCNPDRWFGHVERTSFKSRTAVKGYGKSFYETNREYVRNVLQVRPAKYQPWFEAHGR